MIDLFSLAIGAGLAGLGWFSSEQARRREVRKRKIPHCSCEHPLSDHDPQTKACHGQVQRANKWDADKRPKGWVWLPCTCRQYVGPEPLTSFYTPPIALPPVDEP